MIWVLHIGMPKTGSTAIQHCLFENRYKLLDRGIHYPAVSLRGFGHHDLAFLTGGGYPDWAVPQPRSLSALTDDLRQAVERQPATTTILSSENFSLYPAPTDLNRVLVSAGRRPDDAVKVVCYVRRQDEAHLSWYNQTVKAQGNASGFHHTMRAYRWLWDYADRLRPWQAEFGTGSIHLRDYAPFSNGGADIRRDFLHTVGVDPAPCDLPAERVNARLNRDLLEFQRAINRLPLRISAKRRFHRHLIALTAATAGQGVFDDSPLLSPAQRAELLRDYADSNRHVARTFFGRDDLFEPVVDNLAGHEGASRPGLTPRKLASILKWLLTYRTA